MCSIPFSLRCESKKIYSESSSQLFFTDTPKAPSVSIFYKFGSGCFWCYLSIFEKKNIKKILFSIKKKNSPTICHFLFHTGEKFILKNFLRYWYRYRFTTVPIYVFICSFILTGSGSERNNSGSGKKFRIPPDQDSQPCL